MIDEAQHPKDALQDALDRRLAPEELAEIEAHLASCLICHRELEALRWTKAQVASAKILEAPAKLENRLRRALDEEDARSESASLPRQRLRRLAPWLAAAALLAAIWIGGRFWTSSIPESVADVYRAHASGRLPLEVSSTDVGELERYFAGSGLPFPTRVFDLGMMGFSLEGGGVVPVAGRDGALIAYRAGDGRALLCRMYEGSVADLPEPIDRRLNEGITFHVYREADVTLVFWQEGPVVCVLAAEGDPEAALELAFAKAVKA